MTERRCRYCQKSFQPSKFQPASRSAANRHASDSAAPIITARRSPPILSTARFAATAPENGAPAIRITGGVTAWKHPAAVERNRQQQKLRDRKRHLRNLANNNSALDLKHSAAAVWLVGAGAEYLANNNSAPAQVFGNRSTCSVPKPGTATLQTTSFWSGRRFCRIKKMSHAYDRTDQRPASPVLVRPLADPQDRAPSAHGLGDDQEVSGCPAQTPVKRPRTSKLDPFKDRSPSCSKRILPPAPP